MEEGSFSSDMLLSAEDTRDVRVDSRERGRDMAASSCLKKYSSNLWCERLVLSLICVFLARGDGPYACINLDIDTRLSDEG